MSWLWALPFALQGLLLGADEWVFHRRRGLPRWERIGHPLDTLSVFACLAWLLWVPLSVPAVWVYLVLAAFSCLLITKDEAVHAVRCSAAEHWLHAALFVLHPIVLGVAALFWSAREQHGLAAALGRWLGAELPAAPWSARLLVLQAALVAAVAFYQAIYWNWRRV